MEIRRTSRTCSIAVAGFLKYRRSSENISMRFPAQETNPDPGTTPGARGIRLLINYGLVAVVFFLVRYSTVFFAGVFHSEVPAEDIRLLVEFLCLFVFHSLGTKLA
jgi:hypothetical protein